MYANKNLIYLIRVAAAFAVLISIGLVPAGTNQLAASSIAPQEAETSKISDEESLLETAAVNAQNDGKFRDAAELWRDLLNKHPNSPLKNKALHQLGICEVKLENYSAAESALRDAIKTTNPAEVQTLGRAQLFLGFSRLRLGEQSLRDQKTDEANQWLTSAAEALAVVHEKYPEFPDQDEAAYFQGSAWELLEISDKAIASYRRVLESEKSKFKLDALWALGDLEARARNFTAAKDYLDKYLAEGSEHPSANEVALRSARVHWELARAAQSAQDESKATEFFTQAKTLYEQVAAADQKLRIEALFNLAVIEAQTGELAKSQANFAVVTKGDNPQLAALAAINLGQQALANSELETALKWFDRALELDAESVDAAHFKVQTLLAQNQPQAAYDVAAQAAAKLAPPDQYRLQFDQAEAAYRIAERIPEALEKFVELADKDWPDNARARYNAAFAALTLGQHERALSLVDDFQKSHPDHPFLPDALEVAAEARMAREEFTQAANSFAELIQTHAEHPKQNTWRLRAGVANFFSDDSTKAAEWLTPLSKLEPATPFTAEALYWLGMAVAKSGQPAAAIAHFEQALSIEPPTRTADTLFALMENQARLENWDAAEQTAERLAREFPEAEMTSRALYLVAQHHQSGGEKAKADAIFALLAQMENSGPFAPFAAMNRGWLKVESAVWQEARQEFERAIAGSGADRPLRHQSTIGLATALRNLARPEEAIPLLEKLLADNPAPLTAIDATYELALNLVAEKNWSAAITAFRSLLDNADAKEIVPQVRYELGWALRANQEPEQALAEFTAVAAAVPDTSIGADAQYQVAESLYLTKDFEKAIPAYERALAAAPESLAERIRYRLGWAYFNLQDFPNSYAQFERQTTDFPNGRLLADGLYMLSESAFQPKPYETASRPFRTARPVMEASGSVSKTNLWLSDLHAAQSANQLKKYESALEFATNLVEVAEADEGLRADAYLQLGLAHQGLSNSAAATEAWSKAAKDLSKTGAHARYLLGATLFADQKFKEAILQFSLVRNGYGGKEADPDIDPWQALATFEIARCKNCLAQLAAQDNQSALSRELVGEAIQYLKDLVEEFPDDRLVPDAKREIQKLEEFLNKSIRQ